jgi:hypothetical protein
MMFIGIDSVESNEINGAARSAPPPVLRTPCRRRVHGRQTSGGKGAKGGNLQSLGNTGPADDVAQRRKPAETPFRAPTAVRKYSQAQGSGRRVELSAIGKTLAEIAETPAAGPTRVSCRPSETSETSET